MPSIKWTAHPGDLLSDDGVLYLNRGLVDTDVKTQQDHITRSETPHNHEIMEKILLDTSE